MSWLIGKIVIIWYKLVNIFNHDTHEDKMLSGELIVVGTSNASINLHRKDHPDGAKVHFHGNPDPVPCNPAGFDDVQWSIILADDGFYHLTIYWSVSIEREIKWEVYW